jgi:hypothetical protein
LAKKSRRRPARRSTSGHRAGKPARRPGSRASRHDQALGSLIAFVGWHREHGILPELPVLEQLTAFFAIYDEISGGAPVTAMKPGLIAEFVEVLNERDADFASFFCLSLFEYLHFLRHTGRWSGGDENHWVLHRVLYRGALNENVPP